MAKAFNQKIKILYLMQILMDKTDEDHVLNMQQILQLLEEKEIRAERKSIYDDFEMLRKFGLDIRFRKGHPSGYFLAERMISVKDVQKLVQYLPKGNESEELIAKLKALLSIYQAELVELSVAPEEHIVSEAPAGDAASEKVEEPDSEKETKEIKLLFMEKHMQTVLAHKDCCEDAKEHKSGLYKVKMNTVVDEAFYGWLVSMGFGIKIVKPKAEAEAYRAFLKKLLKQYK